MSKEKDVYEELLRAEMPVTVTDADAPEVVMHPESVPAEKTPEDDYARQIDSLLASDETVSRDIPGEIVAGLPPETGSNGDDSRRPTAAASWLGAWNLGQSILFWVCLLLLALMAIYLFIQTLAMVKTINELPQPWQYAAYGVLGVLGLIVLLALVRLLWFYLRRRTNRQISLRDVKTIRHYEQMQKKCTRAAQKTHSVDDVYKVLAAYVRELAGRDAWNHCLRDSELAGEDYQRFQREQRRLLAVIGSQDGYGNVHDWLDGYLRHYQKFLNDCAARRVEECARWVCVKTAISPYPLWDMLIVIFWAFKLMGDLCAIYNLRVGRYGTMSLVAQLFGTVFLTGKADEAEAMAQVGFEQVTSGFLSNSMIQTIVGTAASKAASGMVNYFLMRRLGRAAVRKLMPLLDK